MKPEEKSKTTRSTWFDFQNEKPPIVTLLVTIEKRRLSVNSTLKITRKKSKTSLHISGEVNKVDLVDELGDQGKKPV